MKKFHIVYIPVLMHIFLFSFPHAVSSVDLVELRYHRDFISKFLIFIEQIIRENNQDITITDPLDTTTERQLVKYLKHKKPQVAGFVRACGGNKGHWLKGVKAEKLKQIIDILDTTKYKSKIPPQTSAPW